MQLDFKDVAGLDPAMARQILPGFLASYVKASPAVEAAFAARVEETLRGASDAEVAGLLARFGTAGEEYRPYPADPLARRVSRAAMSELLAGEELVGLEGLRAALAAGPTLLLSNHLSYVDTQVTDLLLVRHGAVDIADRLLAVAGPKVYGTPFRRLAAVGLSTLKTAQSSSLTYNEASLSPREVGLIALETVRQAGELMAAGHPVLVYAEGSRTRTGRLQPFLRAVARYAALPGVALLPVAISGTDRMFPLDADAMRPAPVRLVFGAPFLAQPLGAREALAEAWRRVAAALPRERQPDPSTPPVA